MRKTLFLIFSLLSAISFMLIFPAAVFSVVPGALSRYEVSGIPFRQLFLPSYLREISGVAVSQEGKLFAHDDEVSTVYQLDPISGRVLKRFHVIAERWFGSGRIEDDFEDIAIVGDRFFLVTSSGKLYEFRDGRDNESVQAKVYKIGLDSSYEVEGLCYDPSTASLLLSTKGGSGRKGTADSPLRPVFSFSLATMKLLQPARFLIDSRSVAAAAGTKGFKPTGIARHPLSGTFLMISSSSRLIAEIDSRTGSLIDVRRLPAAYHPQPEGISVMPDNSLIISSEDTMHGRVSFYRLKTDL